MMVFLFVLTDVPRATVLVYKPSLPKLAIDFFGVFSFQFRFKGGRVGVRRVQGRYRQPRELELCSSSVSFQ